ncbi:MAG: UDP-N-acetylmuramate--L-alanine ligase [Candidatus Pacebacteria bacterium]|nr:UDP-N-acetylmuramate--L-alanine ligase [Candidatus Paceibacterota bacterium]
MSTTPRKVFMSGIGGIGMSALAQMIAERGEVVTGSDREESPTTELLEQKGIRVFIGQKAENVPTDASVLVYTTAVPPDNVERVRARELGIPEVTYFEMLGSASEEKRTIAVAGTHGKTTTTGMIAKILRDAGASPSAVVGSIVEDFGSNYLKGESDLFVVEACEYERHFLTLAPEVLVITNIEFDHTDYYQDLGDVQDAFLALMKKVPAHGFIITDVERPSIAPLLEGLSATVIDYMQEPAYPLRLPGEFNQMNARAASAAAKAVMPNISQGTIITALSDFHGTWRRFEYKGKTARGADVYDDYAHHPTAVKETLRALRERAHGQVYVAFHPHLFSRTRDLLDGFARAFAGADEVLIAPIYPAREVDDGSISSEILATRIQAEGGSARALSFEEIREVLSTEPTEGDVIMTMGAGDIYKVANTLVG